PGLVSDQQLVYKITDYGLIPIGSDAWLAKGQQANDGSIVLIHGNGNEPVGVNDFIKLLQSKTKQIAEKQWLLYDLSSTVEDEEKQGE
ncbi:MAG: polysaccharide deacetylase family protein, partial [Mucilaginibacter sp.]